MVNILFIFVSCYGTNTDCYLDSRAGEICDEMKFIKDFILWFVIIAGLILLAIFSFVCGGEQNNSVGIASIIVAVIMLIVAIAWKLDHPNY